MSLRIDPVFLQQVKNVPLFLVVGEFVQLKQKGAEYVGLSPFKAEKTASFTVNTRKNFFHCFATGEHGNAIDFLEKIAGMDFLQAVKYIASVAGLDLPDNIRTDKDGVESGGMSPEQRAALQEKFRVLDAQRHKDEAARVAKFLGFAKTLWAEARKAEGTLVEIYLEARGIDLAALKSVYGWAIPPSIKYHPNVYYSRVYSGPAMISILQNAKGEQTGVHRTWLLSSGQDKATMEDNKKCLGETWGSGIRLSAVGKHCICGEGIETTLTMMGVLARARGEKVFGFCGVNLNNIAGAGGLQKWQPSDARVGDAGQKKPFNFEPDPERPGLVLPDAVKQLDLLVDADGKDPVHGRNMMKRAAAKFVKYQKIYDVSTALPLKGGDFNDMVDGV